MADRPNPTQPQSASRRLLRRWMTTAVIACATIGSGSGCTIVSGINQSVLHSDCVDEFMVGYRNHAWSAKSWHANKHRFCNQAHNRDFEAGYRQGYEDVANGGNGCTPAMPPRAYWGWRYQSPEGQAKVAAWFAGYPHGAAAAEQEGLGGWSQVRTNLPVQQEMPPMGADPGAVAPGMAPTPLDGVSLGLQDQGGPAAGQFDNVDFSQLTRVSADSVPTAASGR